MTDSFWTKVLWSRFIKHFRKLTDEQIIKDIHESMDALEDNDASGDSFGAKMVEWANERRNEKAAVASRENGNLGGRPRKNQDTTADGDTREDSQAEQNGSAITRNETRAHDALEPSANLYGDAATREGADVSTTVSNIFTTKNPSTISTNRRRTGGPSLSQTSSLPPVRQSEPDVMSLSYSGEFGNVRLTQEQYAELGIKFGNQQKLNRAIDSLSCKLENGEMNPRNHYAELVKWANYRDDMDEKEELKASSAPHYETVSEHNARVVAEGKKWIDAHFPRKDKKNG